jgi:hypothetical protein
LQEAIVEALRGRVNRGQGHRAAASDTSTGSTDTRPRERRASERNPTENRRRVVGVILDLVNDPRPLQPPSSLVMNPTRTGPTLQSPDGSTMFSGLLPAYPYAPT